MDENSSSEYSHKSLVCKLLLAELSDRRREEVLDAMLVAHLDP